VARRATAWSPRTPRTPNRRRSPRTTSKEREVGDIVTVTLPVHPYVGHGLPLVHEVRRRDGRRFVDVGLPNGWVTRLPVEWTDRAVGPVPVVVNGHAVRVSPAGLIRLAEAVRPHCQRFVLASPFTSLPDVAQFGYPWLPARWLVLDRFDTLSRASEIRVPTLVVHGVHDTQIPHRMGSAVAAALPRAKFLSRLSGHNDVFDDGVVRVIDRFLRESPCIDGRRPWLCPGPELPKAPPR